MNADWYKGVNPGLEKLARFLGMGGGKKPSHGYTIAERAPEVVTAPGVYFPTEKGEVIPLEGRARGGNVSPSNGKDPETRKLDILESIIAMIKPSGIENRLSGGIVAPPEPMKLEQSKLDILKSSINILKPPAQPKNASGNSKPSPKNPLAIEPRQNGGSVEPDLYEEAKDKLDLLPTALVLPEVPSSPTGMANLPTTGSYSMKPDSLKEEPLTQMFSRQAGGPVDPPIIDEGEEEKLRRIAAIGPPLTPTQVELGERLKWGVPGFRESALAEAKLGSPNVIKVAPGYERDYYSAHPEERLMEEVTASNKPAMDMAQRLVEEARTRAQGYGVGFNKGRFEKGPGAQERMPEAMKSLSELRMNVNKIAAATAEGKQRVLGDLTKGEEKSVAPRLVQDENGQYVWATPGGVLPAGIKGKQPGDSSDIRTFEAWLNNQGIDANKLRGAPAWADKYKEFKSLSTQIRGEEEAKTLLGDDEAKWLAAKLGSRPAGMAPAQLRSFIGFGSVGQKNLSKVIKALKKDYPEYNFALAELAFSGDKTEINKNKALQGTILNFEKTAIQNAKQVDALSRRIDSTRIPELNRLVLAGQTRIAGDEVASQYLGAWRTFINEYARIATSVSGGGVTSDAARKEVEDILRQNYTPEQMQSVVRQLTLEMEHRRYGFESNLHDVMSHWGEKPEFAPKLPTAADIENIFKTETPVVGAAAKVAPKQPIGTPAPVSDMDKYWRK